MRAHSVQCLSKTNFSPHNGITRYHQTSNKPECQQCDSQSVEDLQLWHRFLVLLCCSINQGPTVSLQTGNAVLPVDTKPRTLITEVYCSPSSSSTTTTTPSPYSCTCNINPPTIPVNAPFDCWRLTTNESMIWPRESIIVLELLYVSIIFCNLNFHWNDDSYKTTPGS